jgi:hypothetical protein
MKLFVIMSVDGSSSYCFEIESCFYGWSSVNRVVYGLRFGRLEGLQAFIGTVCRILETEHIVYSFWKTLLKVISSCTFVIIMSYLSFQI